MKIRNYEKGITITETVELEIEGKNYLITFKNKKVRHIHEIIAKNEDGEPVATVDTNSHALKRLTGIPIAKFLEYARLLDGLCDAELVIEEAVQMSWF